MPHVVVEYSANLEHSVEIDALIERVHRAALDCGVFPPAGLRTRAARRDHYRIADGDPLNVFLHVMARIAPGRSLEVRREAGEAMFDALMSFLEPHASRLPLAVTFEIQEIDLAMAFRHNNLPEWLERRKQAHGDLT